MALFDSPRSGNPKHWKEYSLDLKLMFVYHGCMMVLFMTGDYPTVRIELLITGLLAAVLISLSLRNRMEKNWQWPGVGVKEVVIVISGIAAAAFFDYAAVPSAPPSNPRFLPWHLAGLGIAAFGVLAGLKVIQPSETDFLKLCEPGGLGPLNRIDSQQVPAPPTDPFWKRCIRGVYYVAFIFIWISFVLSFYFSGIGMRDGSPKPDVKHTDPLFNHGQVVFIPHSQKLLIDALDRVYWIGIPAILFSGIALNFFGGIKIFQNMPTYQEWRQGRSREAFRVQ